MDKVELSMRQQSPSVYALLILAGLIAGISGILGNVAAGVIPAVAEPYLWLAWPLFLVFTLLSIALAVWQSRANQQDVLATTLQQNITQLQPTAQHRIDLYEAPAADQLYGRETELAKLMQWVVVDECRLVLVLGIGGIGKTILSAHFARSLNQQFTYVIWRSLRNAPPINELLDELTIFISDQQHSVLTETTDQKISRLMNYATQRRCLLILDNLETILQAGDNNGCFRDGYEAYGELITRFGEGGHRSCMLLTSREKPREVAVLEGDSAAVYTLSLSGLSLDDVRTVLHDRGINGDDTTISRLSEHYSGNPLALKLVAETIREVFHGDVQTFLRDGDTFPREVSALLDQQIHRLAPLEYALLLWLTIEREPTPLESLRTNLTEPASMQIVQEALTWLRRRSLIEVTEHGFSLQNVVMEYLNDHLVASSTTEIMEGRLKLLRSHALLKVSAREYVRESQERLIIAPIIKSIQYQIAGKSTEGQLQEMLAILRTSMPRKADYAAGNLLNLLAALNRQLRDYDFSGLVIWQAYLRGVRLHNVCFAGATVERSAFTETFGDILNVSFSHDSTLFAAGTANGEVRVWRTADSQQVLRCCGHTDWVRAVTFSPVPGMLASASEDQTIRLWSLATGRCLRILRGHRGQIWMVRFSPDGATLASCGSDRTIRLWDVQSGTEVTILTGHTNWVRSLDFSPDGKMIVTGSEDLTVRLWDVARGQLTATLTGHTSRIYSVIFSPDGRQVASASGDMTIMCWDVRSHQCIRTLRGHTNHVTAVAYEPLARLLVSGSEDQTLRLWDTQTGECLGTLVGHTSRVRTVAFAPNGKYIASGAADQTLRLWNVATGRCIQRLQGYINPVWSVRFSPDGKTLASGHGDSLIRCWEVSSGRMIRTLQGHASRVYSVGFSPNGQSLVSASEDQTVRIWDIESGTCRSVLQGHTMRVWSAVFSPDGLSVATGGEDHTVRLWDVPSGQNFQTLSGHTHWVQSVAFSPDGQILASGSDDQTVRLWRCSDGVCIRVLQGYGSRVWSVAFSSDGVLLALGCEDSIIRLYDVQSGQQRLSLSGHTEAIWSIAFSPDASHIISGSSDSTLKLWSLSTGQCVETLTGHTAKIRAVAFSSDGVTLVSGGEDETIRLWHCEQVESLVLNSERPYEGLDITGIVGLTAAERSNLLALGARENNSLGDPDKHSPRTSLL